MSGKPQGPLTPTNPAAATVVVPPNTAIGVDLLDPLVQYGKYFLIRKLAEGGMAEIFLAKKAGPEGFERNVVIKRMLKHLSEDTGFVQMFLDEARLAARLAHQNIVQIDELGLEDGCYFICMEYMAGEDFSTVLRAAGRRREYVPLHLALRVMADAAHGLHFAHDFTDESGTPLRIVHRDVSPSNIFVTYQGQVKVLDFGIARAESRSTRTTAGVVKGKYMYMSPEQARSDPNHPVDRRADVFSLGVSLFEALTNVRPFARDNDLAILNAVLRGEFKPPRHYRPDLPVELEQVVLKAMAVRAEDRYPTAHAFAADLELFLAARTSASGGGQTAAYLHELFGADRVAVKTRIPTTQQLLQSGIRIARSSQENRSQAASGAKKGDAPTVAVSPPSAVTQARRPLVPIVAGTLAGLLLVVAGGGVVHWLQTGRGGGDDGKQVVGAVTPPQGPDAQQAAQAPDAGAAQAQGQLAQAQAQPDAGVAQPEEVVDAQPEPRKELEKKRPRPRPIKLTVAEVQRVVTRGSASIMKCFDAHKADLPSDQGQVTVQFTIVDTGKVVGARVVGPLADSKVGGCLEGRIGALKFPAHTDKQVSMGLPLQYQVKR